MSKYTKEAPFDFEGVKMWREQSGNVGYNKPDRWGGYAVVPCDLLIRAGSAFLEAERNHWHYTNADKTEARKGRWTVFCYRGEWRINHDDFDFHAPFCLATDRAENENNAEVGASNALATFLAWHAAQQQPEEPLAFGYVGYVTGEFGVLDILHGDGNRPDLFHVVGRKDGCHFGQRTWADVLELGTFTPVEDLS